MTTEMIIILIVCAVDDGLGFVPKERNAKLRSWLRAYNRTAKTASEPRWLTHLLPVKSPWLNPIEPRWLHAKRGVCEPDGELPPPVLRSRFSIHSTFDR